MIHLVRKASDTPNITNKDDVRMIRYAYGGQDGVVKNYGSELNTTFSANIVKIGSGRIVLQGWEVDIDEAGVELTFPYTTTGTQYHSVYLEVNALTETTTITSVYNSYESYPDVNTGDDLTQVPNGVARLLLFNVDIYNGTITKLTRKISTILYTKDKLDNILADEQTVKAAVNLRQTLIYEGPASFSTIVSSTYPNREIDAELEEGYRYLVLCYTTSSAPSVYIVFEGIVYKTDTALWLYLKGGGSPLLTGNMHTTYGYSTIGSNKLNLTQITSIKFGIEYDIEFRDIHFSNIKLIKLNKLQEE